MGARGEAYQGRAHLTRRGSGKEIMKIRSSRFRRSWSAAARMIARWDLESLPMGIESLRSFSLFDSRPSTPTRIRRSRILSKSVHVGRAAGYSIVESLMASHVDRRGQRSFWISPAVHHASPGGELPPATFAPPQLDLPVDELPVPLGDRVRGGAVAALVRSSDEKSPPISWKQRLGSIKMLRSFAEIL